MPLFEVAIIEKPTKKDAEDGKGERLILAPKAVLAKDDMGAAIAAVMGEDVPKDVSRERMEVLVRPFA